MGDTISSLLFQPPEPTRLKESHVIFLDTKLGCRIPAFFISNSAAALEDDDIDGGGPTLRSSKELTAACMTGGFGENCGTTLLYSHANAEDLGNIYPWCKFLSKALKVNVLAYDYTGYGLASGQGDPSEENCFADIDAAYSYLRYQLQIPSHKIVLYGRSLGSGPSCYLASRLSEPESEDNPVGGLILHAPFMSVFRIVLESGCTLPGDKFPNCDFGELCRNAYVLIFCAFIFPFNATINLSSYFVSCLLSQTTRDSTFNKVRFLAIVLFCFVDDAGINIKLTILIRHCRAWTMTLAFTEPSFYRCLFLFLTMSSNLQITSACHTWH
uniref:AB hydrolase-1 domain-containing protein n=1 Tax=Ditylum brightwellii TaxID=49249 RepID=A0A7S4W1K2_9STRA